MLLKTWLINSIKPAILIFFSIGLAGKVNAASKEEKEI